MLDYRHRELLEALLHLQRRPRALRLLESSSADASVADCLGFDFEENTVLVAVDDKALSRFAVGDRWLALGKVGHYALHLSCRISEKDGNLISLMFDDYRLNKNQRAWPRVHWSRACGPQCMLALSSGEHMSGRLENLSVGGAMCCFEGPSSLAALSPRQVTALELNIDDQFNLTLPFHLLHQQLLRRPCRRQLRVEFGDLTATQRHQIDTFVQLCKRSQDRVA